MSSSSHPIRLPRSRRSGLALPLGRTWNADALCVTGLAVMLTVLAALTWRKWGVPEIDAGAELTTADRVARGGLAYQDVRYYYGPLGLYSLAGAFKLFGTSFDTVYLFGLAQAVAILGATYALARQWVSPVYAAATTAVAMTIGFSGTAFNFVLPHTNSATVGLLFVLLALLAISHGREVWAGAAIGLVGLTRPEFAVAAWAAAAAYVVATWRLQGRAPALRAAARLATPGVAIPLVVLGAFAAAVGTSRLLWENLWPRDFIRIAGFKTQSDWMPLSVTSVLALAARAALYLGALAAFVHTAETWSHHRRVRRALALWPLLAVVVVAGVVDGAARVLGVMSTERAGVETELHHFMLTMSWLPALGFAVFVVAARALLRRGASPLRGSWPVDAALIAVAAVLGLRAYNAFTTEGSYAPYYAAPLVILLGILHFRVAQARPRAGRAPLIALAVAAFGLGAYAVLGLYADQSAVVHTARGSFVTTRQAATAITAATRVVDRSTSPGDAIFAGPADGGLYFMTDRRPALYEVMVLPGLLATAADQREAIAQLQRRRASVAIIGVRDFSVWGWPRFGIDYNRVLGDWLRAHTVRETLVGTRTSPAAGTMPSAGFEVRTLESAP
jgi:hypothetical protein